MTSGNNLPKFSRNLLISAGLVILLAVAFALYAASREQMVRAAHLRHDSYLLADELRQSGDELKRMVRTYVATGDPVYKQHFQDIFDIREGRKPRPENYWRPYWILILPGGPAPRPETPQAIPLLELMRRAGFTEEELGKLARAKANSDALTIPEFEAMKLVEAPGPDAEASRARAIRMLYDEKYHQAKFSVMKPIDDFLALLDHRTLAALRRAETQATALWYLCVAIGLALMLMLWRTYEALSVVLGGTFDEVYTQIARIGAGDFSVTCKPKEGRKNSVLGWLSVMQARLSENAAERMRAETLLRKSEEFSRRIIESSSDCIKVLDLDGNLLSMSEGGQRLLEIQCIDRYLNKSWISFWKPDDQARVREALDAARVGGEARFQAFCPTEASNPRWWDVIISPIRGTDGKVEGLLSISRDISAKKQAEKALREREKHLSVIANNLPGLISHLDRNLRYVFANSTYERWFGRPPQAVVGRSVPEVVGEEAFQRAEPWLRRALTGEQVTFENHFQTPSGKILHGLTTFVPDEDPDKKVNGVFTLVTDITARKLAEEQVRKLAMFPELNPNPVMQFEADGTLTYSNRASQQLLKTLGSTELSSIQPPETGQIVAECLSTGQPRMRLESRHGPRTLSWSFYPIPGQAVVHCYVGDITDRLQLEQQLRQSQKMEAIGQLAGGVAHDFNNVLAVILMQTELTATVENLSEEVLGGLRQIRGAAERGANLTNQLLLFSRKQVMRPREVDLNDVVTSLAKMLQRIVSEDVSLQLNPHPRPLFLRADPGMLDQVLMNLVVNARDAMPGGGKIIIETGERLFTEDEARSIPDAAPGHHVCLRVKDTGAGIAPGILPRIFEPFFTTKEPGHGTGLGLATVFGIVKQHRGSLTVESEVGRGTTFQVYLPASEETGTLPEKPAPKPKPRGGAEVILVVEDESPVRKLTRIVLERAGYRVLEAANGVEALRIWDEHQDSIRLLVTDMVMPESVSGRELAALLQARNPALRVLFNSGYSAEMAGRELVLKEGQKFLQKPFSPPQLLEAVRRCIDGGDRGA